MKRTSRKQRTGAPPGTRPVLDHCKSFLVHSNKDGSVKHVRNSSCPAHASCEVSEAYVQSLENLTTKPRKVRPQRETKYEARWNALKDHLKSTLVKDWRRRSQRMTLMYMSQQPNTVHSPQLDVKGHGTTQESDPTSVTYLKAPRLS